MYEEEKTVNDENWEEVELFLDYRLKVSPDGNTYTLYQVTGYGDDFVRALSPNNKEKLVKAIVNNIANDVKSIIAEQL